MVNSPPTTTVGSKPEARKIVATARSRYDKVLKSSFGHMGMSVLVPKVLSSVKVVIKLPFCRPVTLASY